LPWQAVEAATIAKTAIFDPASGKLNPGTLGDLLFMAPFLICLTFDAACRDALLSIDV
jgi:hypothetical protein